MAEVALGGFCIMQASDAFWKVYGPMRRRLRGCTAEVALGGLCVTQVEDAF